MLNHPLRLLPKKGSVRGNKQLLHCFPATYAPAFNMFHNLSITTPTLPLQQLRYTSHAPKQPFPTSISSIISQKIWDIISTKPGSTLYIIYTQECKQKKNISIKPVKPSQPSSTWWIIHPRNRNAEE